MALTAEEMRLHDCDGVKYRIIDFKGEIYWARREDGIYAVDPEHLEDFKRFKHIGQYNEKERVC